MQNSEQNKQDTNFVFDAADMVDITDTQSPSENNGKALTVQTAVQSAALVTSVATMLLTSKLVVAATAVSLTTAFACDKLGGSTDYKNTKMVAGAIGLTASATSNLGGFVNNQTANAVMNPSSQTMSSKLMFFGGFVAPFFASGWLYRAATLVMPVAMTLASKPANTPVATQIGSMLEQAGSNVASNVVSATKVPSAMVTCAQEASVAIRSCASRLPQIRVAMTAVSI